MPTIIEMRLQPSWPIQATTRQLHGLACAIFEGQESAGHADQQKPFTIWPLTPVPGNGKPQWLLRTAWLPARLPASVMTAVGQLRIGHSTCAVTDVTCQPANHADLASGALARSFQVTFHSPTYFSQNGTDCILPDPRLIVGSWRRRWNASLPDGSQLEITDQDWQELHHAVSLTSFDLHTDRRDSGRGRERPGFTGTAMLQLSKDASPVTLARFGALARFADFCGTGAQTTHGFGATNTTALNK